MIAHGIDLVDIPTTERLLADPSEQFLIQCFTEEERVAVGDGLERAARLSGRFAVKEAVLKALGTGYGRGIGFRDVEVADHSFARQGRRTRRGAYHSTLAGQYQP